MGYQRRVHGDCAPTTSHVMVTKEELEKSTFIGRNANVWFMTAWALMMFIIDGVVYAVDPPPGESKWGYGPTVFLLCLIASFLWGAVSIKTERAHRGELTRLRETKTLAELMSLNMGATTRTTMTTKITRNETTTRRASSSV